MQIPIDYTTELTYSEKKKIRWVIEEFHLQFKKPELKNNQYSDRQKRRANEIIKYLIDSVDITNKEVLNFLRSQLEQLQNQYKHLLN
ncbi:MAG: hypothetical protein ACTSRZ_12935 [Promethearchaeota archaeon]